MFKVGDIVRCKKKKMARCRTYGGSSCYTSCPFHMYDSIIEKIDGTVITLDFYNNEGDCNGECSHFKQSDLEYVKPNWKKILEETK